MTTQCTEERKCSNCFSDQGICRNKKQEFIDGLNELAQKTGLFICVDLKTKEIAFNEIPLNCQYKSFRYLGDSDHHICFDFH